MVWSLADRKMPVMKGQTCPDITNLKLRVKVCAQEREHREFYLSLNKRGNAGSEST